MNHYQVATTLRVATVVCLLFINIQLLVVIVREWRRR